MSHRCPECQAGKHVNCTGWAYNDDDMEVECNCYCRAVPSDEEGST